MRSCVLTFVLLFATGLAHADKVYKLVDAQGNVLYTDQPRKGAREVDIAVQPAPPVPRQLAALAPVRQNRATPPTLTLSAPSNEETIRDNEGNVLVVFGVEPGLRAGDRVRLAIDGRVVEADAIPPGLLLSGLDQGTHTLQATLTDGSGNVQARSDLVTFYLKHYSINSPHGPGNYPQTYPVQPYPSVSPTPAYKPVYPSAAAPKSGR